MPGKSADVSFSQTMTGFFKGELFHYLKKLIGVHGFFGLNFEFETGAGAKTGDPFVAIGCKTITPSTGCFNAFCRTKTRLDTDAGGDGSVGLDELTRLAELFFGKVTSLLVNKF